MRELVAACLILCATSAASGQDIRQASEEEIVRGLIGCWDQEPGFASLQRQRRGNLEYRTICFRSTGRVELGWMEGTIRGGLDGGDGGGTYQISDERLHLSGEPIGNWFFQDYEFSCDLVMLPSTAMQFRNCIGDDGEALANTSYTKTIQ